MSATRVLAPARVLAAPVPGGPGELRLEGRVTARPGQFVAADVGPQTPYGLLARVVSARREGDGTVLSVEPARLSEAVPAGQVAIGGASAAVAAGGTRRRFMSAFSCTGGVATLAGSLAVGLVPTFKLDWSLDGIDSAEATATLRGDAEIVASVGAGASCTLDEMVASWDGPPLRFALGPIPVVLVPRTALYVSGSASVDAAVETGIHGSVDATAGLRYDGEVEPIGRFRQALSYTPPAAHLTGSVGARVIPSITFLLYGQSGPRFDLAAGLQLDASATTDPWWTLTAPVELSAGLEVAGLGDLSIPQQTVFSKAFPLAQAERTPGPAPGPQPDGGMERARISWDTAATDVDLHVWDEAGHHAWFRDPAGIPSGELSEDDRYGFGPEHFTDRSGGRALTFGLCYFDDSGAGATRVAVRLTDPDGTVRDSTRTLDHEGDHLLLGSSPGGRGLVPPEGWCRP